MREFAGYVQPDGRLTYTKYDETLAEVHVVYTNFGSYRKALWNVTGYDGTTARAPFRKTAIDLYLENRAA